MKRYFHKLLYSLCVTCIFGIPAISFTSCAKSVTEVSRDFNDASHDDRLPCVTKEYKNLQSFDGIDLWAGIDVTYRVGPVREAVVTISENVVDRLTVNVVDGQLRMGLQNGTNVRRFRIKAIVTGPALTSVKVSSGADFNLDETESMGIAKSTLSLSASSGADISLKGKIEYKKVNGTASSGADIKLANVVADEITVASSSGADIDVYGIQARVLSATSSSGADISLSGQVDRVSLSASSGADISARKLIAEAGNANASSSGDISCSIKNPTSLHHSSGGSIKNN